MKYLILSILLLFMSSCGSIDDNCVTIDPENNSQQYLSESYEWIYKDPSGLTIKFLNGSNAEIAALQIAVDKWNTILNYPYFSISEEDSITSFISISIVTDLQNPINPSAEGSTDLRVYSCYIHIKDSRRTDPLVYMHELGHCLNLGHSPYANSVMFKYTCGGEEVLPDSINLLSKELPFMPTYSKE